MSLLAPLYFAGALAIGLPILFHLIRRRPKGEVEFSSLMFLRPTPPRLTRKSRLDNLPLLLIRALALILLAAAFARPFLRSIAQSDADMPTRRMVLVIDTSASMQRSGLWQQALDKAGDVISDLQRSDQLAIVTFDSVPKTLLGFEQASQLSLEQLKSTAKSLLADSTPTWNHTNTGRAISYAADLAVTYEPQEATIDGEDMANVASRLTGPAHMILISDMQAGSQIESLQVYSWPEQLRLDVIQVIAKEKTNAAAQILLANSQESPEDTNRVRVRVTNSPDASESRFSLAWSGASGEDAQVMPVQVPPGESRVVRMPVPKPGVTALLLSGDDHAFDNTRYLVSPQPESLSLLHLGSAAAEPRDSLLYYLQRIPLDNERRIVSIDSLAPETLTEIPDAKKTPLIVVDGAFSSDIGQRLSKYISAGGRLLYVLADNHQLPDVATGLNGLIGSESDSQLQITEGVVDDYAMLSRIDFTHPVFAPMADPQFNDFTKIRIWSHRKIIGMDDAWQVLCRFDDDDPALIERTIGEGRLWILATGWQPKESQLALSTKFIPLIFSLFDTSGGRGSGDRFTLGQAIDLDPSPAATITNPAGSAFKYQSSSDADGIDQPGIYQFSDGQTGRTFAVNLDESESRTEALAESELERFGVTLGKQLSTAQTLAEQRQLRDIELEGRQKLWQWLLVAGMALLALETWLGGWISRGRSQGIESALE